MNTLEPECPVWVPSPAELSDVELLLDGAFRPLTGFLGAADVKSVRSHGRLTDGTAWPAPITLAVPAEVAECSVVGIRDEEGAPVAVVDNVEPWSDGVASYLAGPVRAASAERMGPLRKMRPPAEVVRSGMPEGPVLAVPVTKPLHHPDIARIRCAAEELGAHVLLLPYLTGLRPGTFVQAVLAARPELPVGTTIVPVPLGERADADVLGPYVAASYGATHLMSSRSEISRELPVREVAAPEVHRDSDDQWKPARKVPPERRRDDLTGRELRRMLDAGTPLPSWFTTAEIAEQQARLHPALTDRGFTVLFTGLSGAGKSTVARGLRDELAQHDHRDVTLLDGDVVRRSLCQGLGFSAEDRSRNVRRIGWVAAEVARHGGAAICAPIAPYDDDRADVRRRVREVGEFLLVYVATPLAECERRDRKGLYMKARNGALPGFTGVSAPYEEPEDADLVLDTSSLSTEQAVDRVVEVLRHRGWVRPWISA